MIEQALVLAALAAGHLCLLVTLLNWSHGQGGLCIRRHELIVGTLLALVGLASLAAWCALAPIPWRTWPLAARAYLVLCAPLAGVALPAITLARALRRLPEEVAGTERDENLAAKLGTENLLGTAPARWVLRLPGNHSFRLRTTDWNLTLPSLPLPLDGLSLLHISDLHFTRAYDRRFFETIADTAASLDCDLALFTGDLLDDDACLDWIEPVFSRMRGRTGSLAILGNHDRMHPTDRIAAALAAAGFTVLEGAWANLDYDGATLAVGGTRAPWGPLPSPECPPRADFRLLLSHTPDLVYWARARGIDLMLSGHNHGGQIRLPGLGPILMPSRYGRRFDRGFFRIGSTWLHVSQGLSAKFPYRFHCLPELTRLVLRAGPQPASAPNCRRPISLIRASGQTSRNA